MNCRYCAMKEIDGECYLHGDRYTQDAFRFSAVRSDRLAFEKMLGISWSRPTPIFAFLGHCLLRNGCLTQIRAYRCCVAEDEALTRHIKSDARIPKNEKNITFDDLNVFIDYQREVDRMYPGRWSGSWVKACEFNPDNVVGKSSREGGE